MSDYSDSARLAVIAAQVAALLYEAELVARQLSLTAKNASCTVVRAGVQAAGLKVIAEFFGELANITINQSTVVNEIAVEVSRISVREWRLNEFAHHLERAREKSAELQTVRSTDGAYQLALEKMEALSNEYTDRIRYLRTELEEIWRQMRAADVIVVSSRIEAPKTGEYQSSMLNMADNIKDLSSEIKSYIRDSRELLEQTQ